jgi:nitroreductase
MELLELIKHRRSIRKYQDKQIPREDLEKIITAGLYAPNAGGGQRRYVVAMHDKTLCERVGRLNASCMRRTNLAGSYVSAEQPSLIDDPTIKSGFYGAPTVCAVFGPSNFLYSVPDAFCCAQNMTLMAAELGIASCIVARGEETFQGEFAQAELEKWQVPAGYVARCFVLLGYCDGAYPQEKPRKDNSYRIVED